MKETSAKTVNRIHVELGWENLEDLAEAQPYDLPADRVWANHSSSVPFGTKPEIYALQ